tara:strand:- start:307 stop:534 length:228 start_codon:yes stop_codon:yes gene_type:complete
MLLQICEYIRREGVVSNQQIARAFHLDISSLQPMLDRWLEKGVIEKCPQPSGCKSRCFRCQQPPEYYAFVMPNVK